jgi:hypothetical protein
MTTEAARALLDSLGQARGRVAGKLPRESAARRMQLVLVLPDLLDLVGAAATPARAPGLAELLAWSGAPTRNAAGLDAEIASRYGIARQTDWPLAAVRAASLGVPTGDLYWLAADPVTLVVGRDDVAFSGVVDDLTVADAAALVATLNAHFADDEIAFAAPRPDAIFACLAAAPRLATHPPAATPDRPLRLRLPEGADAPKFRRWQSEIQMLLHEHPVNVAREKNGRPPVNGIWFSAGGALPPRPSPAPAIRTLAGAGITVALAAHLGAWAQALPADIAEALDDARGAAVIVVELASDVGIAEIDRSYALPARDALARGRLEAIDVLARDAADALCWRARRPGLWRRIAGRAPHGDLAAALATAIRT